MKSLKVLACAACLLGTVSGVGFAKDVQTIAGSMVVPNNVNVVSASKTNTRDFVEKQLNENRAEIMMLSESSAPIEEKSAELHDLKEKNLQICISLFEATEGYKKLNELKNMKPGKRILKIQDYRERIIGDIRESFLDVMNNLRENCRSLTNEDLFYCLLSLLHCPKDLLLGIMDASSDAIKARKHRIKDKMDTVLFDKVFGSDNQKLM